MNTPKVETDEAPEAIAVIAMAGRFPGAKDVDALWANLCAGVDSISRFTDEELIAGGIDPALVRQPNYVKAGGVLGDVDLLDAPFFGLHAREAALMDPQHRLFLECAWEAMERAGYSPSRQPGRVGVFAGQSMNTYLLTHVYPHVAHVQSVESLQASIGNDKDSLTTEVAYRLGLTGPAVTIQSSSSTSLTAIHYACQGLLGFECDMALAGGVSIHVPEKAGYMYYEGGTSSPDGRCRTFDARAAGFVAGHGAGVVVLRRLSDALAAGDPIYAVVRGSAVNNDGTAKVSYMAPSVGGQAEVIALAQAVAGTPPETIGYVEAHGTATIMGDPIEVAALTQAFRQGTDDKGYCALGSIKTNIGHLDAAAGVAGFIKVALMLHHKKLPPSLHFETPNPRIDFAGSPFYVNTSLRDWPSGATPRRAGVTSLGMGGTNAHCVLEEAPQPEGEEVPPRRRAQLLLLSARTEAALDAMTADLAARLAAHPEVPLADVAFTLAAGRKRHPKRRALLALDAKDAAAALGARDPRRLLDGTAASEGRPVAFLFSGQGSQHPDMARRLYETEPLFRAGIDRAAGVLGRTLGRDLRDALFPSPAGREAAAEALRQTALAQPALFAVEHALATLWTAWGVAPRALLGHSIGEYVAACLAGVFSFEAALGLVAARGRLMQGMPPGSMLAVPLGEAEVLPLLGRELSLAAVNGPATCVVAGPAAAVDALEARLRAEGRAPVRLHTSHAFHSSMMDPILDPFREEVRRAGPRAPSRPFLSNVTGTSITPEEATSPDYWARHLRSPVRFADNVARVLADPDAILVEVGPGQALATLARQHAVRGPGHLVVASLPHARDPQPDDEHLLGAAARLWLAGVEPDVEAIAGHGRRRVVLPTYPFERRRYWIEPKEPQAAKAEVAATATEKLPVERWFSVPSWREALPPIAGTWRGERGAVWVLAPAGEAGLGAAIAARLVEAGRKAAVVVPGADFARVGVDRYAIDPTSRADWDALVAALRAAHGAPGRILHLWCAEEGLSDAAAEARGLRGLVHLIQALDRAGVGSSIAITVVTARMHALGDDPGRPMLATVLGPCRVAPAEHPNLACKAVDVAPPPPGSFLERALAERILDESGPPAPGESVVAWRGPARLVRSYEAVPPGRIEAGRTPLRDGGTYLLVGGLGTVGFAHARALAARPGTRLVLVSRSPLPPRAAWDRCAAELDPTDPVRRRIEKVRALEAAGAAVMLSTADGTDAAALQAVVHEATARFGPIRGAVFAAGTVDRDLWTAIRDLDEDVLESVIRTRIAGPAALAAALAGQPLEFCLLASSLASVLGGLGLCAYAAATSFMDAVAAAAARTSPARWVSAGWDGWTPEPGGVPHELSKLLVHFAIDEAEGVRAVERLLSLDAAGPLAIAASALPPRIAAWERGAQAGAEATEEAGVPGAIASVDRSAGRAPRPALASPFVAPRSEAEAKVAALWAETLGLAEVGVHDNFFDLGGNSLVGVKLIALVRERLGVSVPAVSLYEEPTVEALARRVGADAGDAQASETAAAGGEEEDEAAARGAFRRDRRRRGRGPASSGDDE